MWDRPRYRREKCIIVMCGRETKMMIKYYEDGTLIEEVSYDFASDFILVYFSLLLHTSLHPLHNIYNNDDETRRDR